MIWTVLLIFLFVGEVFGQSVATAYPPTVATNRGVVMNMDSGEIIWCKDCRVAGPPASTLKILTALVTAENDTGLNDPVTILPTDVAVPSGSTVANLVAGAVYSTSELLYGLMVPSGNDAALALARYIGNRYLGGDGTPKGGVAAFVARMNTRAKELHAVSTTAINPHGFDAPGQATSPLDLAKLTVAAARHTGILSAMNTDVYRGTGVANGTPIYTKWVNTIDTLRCGYPAIIASKYGLHSTRNQVSIAAKGGIRYVVVLQDDPIPAVSTYGLLDFAYLGVMTTPQQSVCQESNGTIGYEGAWYDSNAFPDDYDRTYAKFSMTAGAVATVNFNGSGIEWIAYKAASRGIAEVSVDDVTQTVDLYSPATQRRASVFKISGLAPGPHRLRIRVTGRKNPASSGTTVEVDAIRIER